MNKTLLALSLLFSGSYFSQSMTQNNEPQIGDNLSMYICDSLTENGASTKGNGVTWDFSNVNIPDTNKRTSISVIDASTTKFASDYTSANKAISIQDFITNYYSSTSNDKTSTGYTFYTKDMGDVKAKFNTDAQITHTYPFSFGSKKEDSFSGKLSFTYNYNGNLIPQNPDATGVSFSEIDGQGTLKLGTKNILTNVLRYHIADTMNAFMNLGFISGYVKLVRDQYEYYVVDKQNLPVYTHTNLKAYITTISPDPIYDRTIVLSQYKPENLDTTPTDTTTSTASIQNVSNIKFSIYPNPANNNITVNGLENSNHKITILNSTGQTIKQISNSEIISIQELKNGIYFLQIESEKGNSIEKFTKL